MKDRGSAPLRVLVVDDEPPARRVLLALLGAEPDIEVVGACGNGLDAIQALNEEDVDVLFLDIQMPEVSGFDVLEAVDDDALPLVVFVTAYDEHAVRAFEVGALDYVLKPFDDERFRATLARVRDRRLTTDRSQLRLELRRLSERMAQLDGEAGEVIEDVASGQVGHTERIPIRLGKRVTFVDLEDVRWIEADNYYVRLHTEERTYLLRETLTRLEARLDPKKFIRVHRSAIVRIQCVKELLVPNPGRFQIALADGTHIPVSRSRKAEVMRALGVGSQ